MSAQGITALVHQHKRAVLLTHLCLEESSASAVLGRWTRRATTVYRKSCLIPSFAKHLSNNSRYPHVLSSAFLARGNASYSPFTWLATQAFSTTQSFGSAHAFSSVKACWACISTRETVLLAPPRRCSDSFGGSGSRVSRRLGRLGDSFLILGGNLCHAFCCRTREGHYCQAS